MIILLLFMFFYLYNDVYSFDFQHTQLLSFLMSIFIFTYSTLDDKSYVYRQLLLLNLLDIFHLLYITDSLLSPFIFNYFLYFVFDAIYNR